MATIVIDVDNRSSASKIMQAIRLFSGVRNVVLEKDVRYPHLDKSIQEINEGKVTRCKSVDELMDKLNS
ncbi:MAG: hypothetical protein FWH18_00105 [Marinilabiliaceae bacterium]|nr:hypothetical protein [Marinilabiliaceae bacterium]